MSSYVLARFRFKGSRKLKGPLWPGAAYPFRRPAAAPLFNHENPGLLRWPLGAHHLLCGFQPSGFHVYSYQLLPNHSLGTGGSRLYRRRGVLLHILAGHLPLGEARLATCGVLAFLGAWNEFQIAMTLTSSTEKADAANRAFVL